MCHVGRLVLNKNAKKPFVAICFGFREKIASLTGLLALRCKIARDVFYTYIKNSYKTLSK